MGEAALPAAAMNEQKGGGSLRVRACVLSSMWRPCMMMAVRACTCCGGCRRHVRVQGAGWVSQWNAVHIQHQRSVVG